MSETVVATIYLGFLLLFCLLLGRIASHLRIPKVTGYIAAGIMTGPSSLGFFSVELSTWIYNCLDELRFLSDLALGLIAFNLGGEFQHERFKKMGKQIVTISLIETFITFSVVFCLLIFFTRNMPAALCLGICAIATAPCATLLVLREYDSEGFVTNALTILTGLNNLICLGVFTLCFPIILIVGQGGSIIGSSSTFFLSLTGFLSSLAIGFILGFLFGILERRFAKPIELIVLVVATVLLGIGISHMLKVSPLLINLVMGATIVNLSKKGTSVFEEVKKIDLPFYAGFFAITGASLHWGYLPVVGWIAVLYCGARTVGKLVGVAFGAKQANAGYSLQRYGGCGLLAQGSVAVGLALLVLDKDQQLGQIVSTTIFSSIIIIEILGPRAIRWSIVKSGEVKIFNLIHRDEGTPFREFLKEAIIWLRTAFGVPLWKNKHVTDEILVEHIMRKHFEAFHEEIHFDQILKVIEHSRYNLFPVINKRGELTGMISFKDIGNVLYDEMMKDLVIAKDIANPTKAFIRSKDTISEALDLFEREKVDILPVIDNWETKHLLGIVTQRDVLAVFKEKRV